MNKLTAIILYTDVIKGCKTKKCRSVYNITKKTTIIQEQIKSIRKIHRNTEIIVVAGKGFKDIEQTLQANKIKNVKLVHEKNHGEINQAKVLLDIIDKMKISNNIMLIIGEILFKNISYKSLKNTTTWLIDKKRDNFDVNCRTENDKAQYFFYDLPNEKQWSEMLFINSDTVDAIKSMWRSKENSLRNIFIFELLNRIIEDESNDIEISLIKYRNILKVKNDKEANKARIFIK